jgi:hypothetical protein
VDTLTRFLQDGFDFTDDQQTADFAAFLLSFAGSDLPTNTNSVTQSLAPGTAVSLDAPAATGIQLLLGADASTLDPFIARANSRTGRVDLIVRAVLNNVPRGWLFTPANGKFKQDTQEADLSRAELFAKLNGTRAVFMLTPAGAGMQMALDRDLDGALNFDEVLAGSDPADPTSLPGMVRIVSSRIETNQFVFAWVSPLNRAYKLVTKAQLSDAWSDVATNTTTAAITTNSAPIGTDAQAYFAVEVLPP